MKFQYIALIYNVAECKLISKCGLGPQSGNGSNLCKRSWFTSIHRENQVQ
jgi:hypothetical protein